jgi:hypothetical protein
VPLGFDFLYELFEGEAVAFGGTSAANGFVAARTVSADIRCALSSPQRCVFIAVGAHESIMLTLPTIKRPVAKYLAEAVRIEHYSIQCPVVDTVDA